MTGMAQKPIWIQNISQLVTLASKKKGPRVREEMRELGIIEEEVFGLRMASLRMLVQHVN